MDTEISKQHLQLPGEVGRFPVEEGRVVELVYFVAAVVTSKRIECGIIRMERGTIPCIYRYLERY